MYIFDNLVQCKLLLNKQYIYSFYSKSKLVLFLVQGCQPLMPFSSKFAN